jgi:hypothetical protein
VSDNITQKVKKVLGKMGKRELYGKHLQTFLDVLKYLTDTSEYAEDELYGWEKIVQVNLKDRENFYIKTNNPFAEHPKLEIKQGNTEFPDSIINTDGDTFTGIMCGRVYLSMENAGTFRVEGDNTQALIFFMLLRLTRQEHIEQKRQAEKD